MQNPEPSVDFDTVANTKQQHEVNVGKMHKPLNTTPFCFQLLWKPQHPDLITH